MPKKNRSILLISDSEKNSNMRYASGFKAPDPFICIIMGGKTHLIASPLEYERARKESSADIVFNSAEMKIRTKGRTHAHVFLEYMKKHRSRTFEVPADFPLIHADILRKKGFRLKYSASPLFPERMVKTGAELTQMEEAVRSAENAMKKAETALRKAKINKKGILVYKNRILTSEKLKSIIQVSLAEDNASASGTIAAGGDQACDPHCSGYGPLKEGEPVIIDIFPRNNDSGYHGDITRTFIKGKPSAKQLKMYRTVKAAHKAALSTVKPGIASKKIHIAASELIKKRGYKTCITGGVMEGFIHSTGHGLGLDVHEHPGVSGNTAHRLKSGNVITIEPGLYYPGIGAVRIEDDVVVTPKGCRKLTSYHYNWIIP